MANKDITESGVQEVLRTMGIPTSFKGFREDVTGRAEALATVGSGMAGTMAGMGGGMIEMLRSGNPQAALDQYRQIQEAMTFVPRTQGGLERIQQIGEFLEPVANIYEQFGEGVAEQTGSPVVGEFAQEFVDPLDLMGLGAVSAIPAIARKSRFAENVASQTTQRANTVGTAVKAANYLDEIGAKGKTLDYGAGLGENAKAINADETFEPFPQGEFNPTYTDPAQVPANAYGRIVSTNVLNVLPPDIRQEAVLTIGKALEPDGTALIQTWDVGAAKAGMKSKKATPVESEENAYTTSTGSYQKGFSKQELQEYIAETLGPGFLVEPVPNKAGISGTAVTIKKIADPSIELDLGLPQAQMDEIAQQYIKAYHGSPYDFEKFMLEFMGSGEGAQAYGHGLYFAEEPDVARGYRKDVTAQRAADEILPIDAGAEAELNKVLNFADTALANVRDTVMFESKNPTMEDIQRVARQKRERSTNEYYERAYETIERMASEGKFTLPEQGTDLNAIYHKLTGPRATNLDYQKAEIIEQIMIDGDVLGVIDRQKEFNQFTPEAYAWFEKEIEPTFKAPGTLYEVNIKASPDELLDWDKPFGEQSQKVKDAINDIFDERSQQIRGRPQIYTRPVDEVIENITGSDLYNRLAETEAYTKWAKEGLANGTLKMSETNTPKSVSMFLESRGIKGITYADQLSRAAEGGTNNFVIFDPRIIKIAKKYGVAIPVAGAMLLQIEKELEKQTEEAPVA